MEKQIFISYENMQTAQNIGLQYMHLQMGELKTDSIMEKIKNMADGIKWEQWDQEGAYFNEDEETIIWEQHFSDLTYEEAMCWEYNQIEKKVQEVMKTIYVSKYWN